jgi:hypothetical protein
MYWYTIDKVLMVIVSDVVFGFLHIKGWKDEQFNNENQIFTLKICSAGPVSAALLVATHFSHF